MSRPLKFVSPAEVARVTRTVGEAETAFRSRWRMSTLARIDPDLHARLVEQIDLYSEDLIGGEDGPLQEQAGAMVRGWAAACSRMQREPDDAYFIGKHWPTRTAIVISDSKGSVELARGRRDTAGMKLVFMTPDELALVVAGLGEASTQVKQLFPDAEVTASGGLMLSEVEERG